MLTLCREWTTKLLTVNSVQGMLKGAEFNLGLFFTASKAAT